MSGYRKAFGPIEPHVDPQAEEARNELLGALQAAFPKAGCVPKAPPQTSPTVEEVDSDPEDLGTDPEEQKRKTREKNEQDMLEKMTYLSKQSLDERIAWSTEKANKMRCEGNSLFKEGDYAMAKTKYFCALDLLGSREAWPEKVQKTHDDLVVLCHLNLAACALCTDDADAALEACEQVLKIEPENTKARYRRTKALIRQGASGEKSDEQKRWASGRPQPSATRAQNLLKAQEELADLCESAPKDTGLLDLVEELFVKAKDEGVHLRPPSWMFPEPFQDFEYIHAPSEPVTTGGNHPGMNAGPETPGLERNLMIFLHGFGDRGESFAKLATSLKLPKTACLCLDGTLDLPDEWLDNPPGYSWFVTFDESTADFITPGPREIRRLRSLEKTSELLAQVFEALFETCGWDPSEVFLFGYGQGGNVALDLLLHPPPPLIGRVLGGTVAVATALLPERLQEAEKANGRKPTESSPVGPAVLFIHGERDTSTRVDATKSSGKILEDALGAEVKLKIFPDRGSEMLRGRHAEEMRCLMEWLSDHLKGVGRHGSREAMNRMVDSLGAEEISEIELESMD